MAFAPILNPGEADPDRAAVAAALADQPFEQTTAMPPPPVPGGELTPEQLAVASLPPSAAPPIPGIVTDPVDRELAAATPVPAVPVPGAPPVAAPVPVPATATEFAKQNAQTAQDIGAEQVANATEAAKLNDEKARAEATEKAAHAERVAAFNAEHELHRQAAQAHVAEVRAKAEGEPYHSFWETRSAGQQVAIGLGLILGGVSWNANHVNRGVEMLKTAMENDLQLQRDKHAGLWKAVDAAEQGVRDLDASELHELSQFQAVEGAKWDAISSRLNSMIAANKGKGDIATAKKVALDANAKAATAWENSEKADALANHLKAQDAELARHHAETEKTAALRAAKYNTRGKGAGGGGGGKAYDAAVQAMQTKANEKDASLGDVILAAGNAIPRKERERLAKDFLANKGKAAAADARELKLTEADEARVVRDTKGRPLGLAPKANLVGKIANDLAAQEKYAKLIEELATDVEKNGRILDSADHPQTEKGRHRMSIFAEVQALGRVLAQLQATDSGTRLEHQMIGNAGVGLNPFVSILSPKVLRELGSKNSEQVNARLRSQLTPMPSRMAGAAGSGPPQGSKPGFISDGRAVWKYPDGTIHLKDGSEVTKL